MSDSVKNIFVVLIKIPIIVAIAYILINLFAFTVSYFRVLGASYEVMQVAMENNYIPNNEKVIINDNLNKLETVWLPEIEIVGADAARAQYGAELTVGVRAKFKWLTPFRKSVIGYKGASKGASSKGTMGKLTDTAKKSGGWNINITYKVPGLKYYPDLTN